MTDPTSEETETAVTVDPAALDPTGQFPIQRYREAGATDEELVNLVTEFAAMRPEDRDSDLRRIASVSTGMLAEELEARRQAGVDEVETLEQTDTDTETGGAVDDPEKVVDPDPASPGTPSVPDAPGGSEGSQTGPGESGQV